MENLRQNLEKPEIKSNQNQNEISENQKMISENQKWEDKRKRINEKRICEKKTKSGKPLSKWHAARLRILEETDDYASFIQFIKWMGGDPPNENDDDENEYLSDLKDEFRSLGGYEFFEEHGLFLPPCGVSIENTFFD